MVIHSVCLRDWQHRYRNVSVQKREFDSGETYVAAGLTLLKSHTGVLLWACSSYPKSKSLWHKFWLEVALCIQIISPKPKCIQFHTFWCLVLGVAFLAAVGFIKGLFSKRDSEGPIPREAITGSLDQRALSIPISHNHDGALAKSASW